MTPLTHNPNDNNNEKTPSRCYKKLLTFRYIDSFFWIPYNPNSPCCQSITKTKPENFEFNDFFKLFE